MLSVKMAAILSRGDELTHWSLMMYGWVSWVIFTGAGNGLVPTRHQAIAWTFDDLWSSKTPELNCKI